MSSFIARPEILDHHEEVGKHYKWGNRGPNGKLEVAYKEVKDLDTDHIFNILTTQYQITSNINMALTCELYLRATK